MSMCMLREKNSVNGKTRMRVSVGAALLAVSLLFVSCPREVGLGAAVDTQKPQISILKPEADSVLKDVINLSGKASDETSLESVTVKFQSTESSFSKSYPATFDSKAGTWSLSINTEDATNGLPDSKYEVTVTAKDKSGKSSIAARSFQIDNAAPTILVTKPSTFGGNDTVLFYKQIDICGEAWDASEITDVKIGLYKDDGTLIIEKSLTESQIKKNIDVDGTTTWSSLFYETDVRDKVTYDNTVNKMSEPIYFYVAATDKAGNTSTYFYHKSDMYSLLKQKKTDANDELLFPKITQIGHLDQGRSAMTVTGSNSTSGDTISVDVYQSDLDATKHEAFSSTLAGVSYPHLKFTTVSTANINWTNIPEVPEGASEEEQYPAIGVNNDIYATIQPVSDGSAVDLDSLTVWFVDSTGSFKKYTHKDNADKIVTTRVGEAVNVTIKTNGEGLAGKYTLYLAGVTNSGTLIGQDFENNTARPDNGGQVKLSFVATSIVFPTFSLLINDTELTERKINDVWYFKDTDTLKLKAVATGLLPDTKVKITYGDNRDVIQVPGNPGQSIPDQNGFTGISRSANECSFTYEFDKSKFSDGLACRIEVTAGEGSVIKTEQVMVQKDMTGPTLSITTPTGTQSNAQLVVEGRCLEAVGCGVDTAEYQIDGGTWTPFTAAEYNTNTGIWQATLKFGTEGEKTLKVRASDKLGNTSETPAGSFIYDTSNPAITFTPAVPSYYKESDKPSITISGKATDNFGIDTFTVKVDNESPVTVPVTGDVWTLTYTIGGTTPELSEGTHKLTFTATDKAGKITAETIEFTVDTVKPVIKGRNFYTEFGTPNEALNTETVWFTDSNVSINVNTVEATSGIDKVQYKFDSDANWSDVSNPSATSFVEKSLDDGEHKVYLQAIDHAGNVSDTATYTFKVDTSPSVLTVGALTGTNMYFKSAEVIYFTDSPLTLTGTVQDDNGLDVNEAVIVKVGSEKHVVKANEVTGDPRTGATWSVTIPVTDLSESGPKQITVQAKDAKGNVCTSDTTYLAQKDTTGPVVSITAPAANDQFNSQTVTVKGTCSDNGAGVNDTETGKKLSYSIDGGTNWTEFTTAQFTGSNWQADVDFGSAEGDKKFRVRVSDKLGNKTETADVSFIYDTAEPTISFTADVKDYYNAGNKPSITISGKAEDNYGIKDNKITVAIDSKTPENLSLTSGSWTLTKTIGEGTPDLAEGNHTVTFSVTDKAGKPYSVKKTFFVDTGKPVIKSSNFFTDAGDRKTDTIWFTDKFVTLNIKVEDGTITSGVGKVQYKFDDETAWSEVPNPAVSNTINKEFTDGGHSLQVKVTDKAGNESVVETFSFKVDTTSPVFSDLTFEAVSPANEYEKDDIHYVTGEVKISGKVTDSNGFDATEPLVVKYGTSSFTLTPAAADGSWYINISGDKFSESATTTVTLEAKDASGRKTSTTYKVRKDVSYPALTVTPELTDGKKITDLNKRTFAFTITDTGVGIKSVKSVLNGVTKDETAEFNIVFDEGMDQSLSIIVEDQLGNTKTYSYTGINVDAAPPVLSDITPQPTYLKEGDVYKFGGTAVDNRGGKASDNIGLGEVRVTAKRDNVTITTPNMDGYWYKSALIGTGPIALNIPDFTATGSASDLNGTWSFTIEVLDSADNIASEKREFTVDVSKPAAPTVNDYPGKVLLTDSSSPYQFRGTDSDVGTGIAKVQYCTTNSTTDSDWADVTGTNSWVEGISIASEGEGNMYFRAIDYAGNISDVTTQPYTFDATAPSLDDLTCSESSDFTNKSFSITATAWDGWKLDTTAPITMTQTHSGINGGNPVTVTVPAGTSSGTHGTGIVDTWVFTGLPADASGTAQTNLVSGKYTYEVTAKDAAGKKTKKTIAVTVDNTNPEKPVIEAPNATQINTNAVFGETYQFRGTAKDVTDGSGLKQIQYQFTTTDVEPTDWTNISFADGPWSFSMNLKEGQTSDIAAGNLAEGRWYLWVRAEDKAGNISAVEKREFDIDLKTPTVAVSEPSDITKTTYVKDSITIKGTATDTNGLKAADAVKVTVSGGTPQYATVTGDNWEITLSNADFTKDTQLTATITAIDAVGKEANTSVPFYFDTTGPVVEINVPQPLVAVSESSYEIRGTVSDAGIGKIKRVYYTLGDTLPTTATETRADIAADGRSWTQTISLSGEGTKKLNILAEDNLGNLNTVKTVEFYYDLAVPEITETNIGDSGLSTNAAFTLSGTASDTNQLSTTRPVQIQASTTANVLTPGVSGNSWTQSYVVGSTNSSETNYIPDGTTLFTIIAEDITGKTTRITRTVTVDTTPPSVSLNAGDGFENSLVEKDTSPYNLLTVQASDTGAGATGLAGVYYQIASSKPVFTEATESSWTSMAQGTNGWIANVNFSDISADGEVKAWVAAKDRVGNRFVFDTAITTWVDIHKPVLTLTGDDFTGGSDVTLTITSTDTNPDKPTVAVTLPGGTASTVTVEANLLETDASFKKYEAVIPFSETNDLTADGTYTITINGKDTKGRDADPVTHEILRDKTAPAVELTSYNTDATYQSLKTVTLTGKVTDPNLTTVTAQLSGQPATDIRSLLGADGSFEWKQYDLADDTYTITVVAKDKANNTTTVKTKNIIIDTTAPDSTFAYETTQASDKLYDTTGTVLSGDALTAGTTYLAKTQFTLKGVITDDNFDSAVLNIKKDSTVLPSVTIPSAGAWSYVQNRVDATYEYMLTVIDKAGNRFDKSLTVIVDAKGPDVTIITPAEGESFLNKPITIRGTITDDGAGVKELLYSQNGNAPSLPVDIAGSSWTKEIDFATEGIFTLKVRASDLLGNSSSLITRNFSYDLYDPQLTETRIGDSGLTTNGAFGFSGKAWDSNALDEITVTDGITTWSNKSGDGKVQAITLDAAAGKCATEAEVAADNWSIDFVVGTYSGQKPATWVADGTTTYTITVKDIAGKSRSYNRTVTVDTTKPTITKETGDGFSKTLVEHDGSPFSWLTVHASDTGAGATGLAGVYYQIAAATPDFTPATESNWSAMAQGTNGWTVNVDFSAITADGTVKVYVAAKDQAGNRAIYDGFFSTYVDMTKPVLSLESGSGFTDAKADVELVVRVTDSNPDLPSVLIKDKDSNEITDPGVSIEEIPENTTATYKEYTITVPFKTNSSKYAADGTYTVYIDGTDKQGRQADAITHRILRDTSAPTVTLSTYNTVESFIANGTLTVQGTVTDGNLIKVEAWLEKDGTAQPVQDITNELDDSGNFTWKQYDLTEGVYYVHVKGTDKAGLTGEAVSKKITVDKSASVTDFAKGPVPGGWGGEIPWTAGATYNQKEGYTLVGEITEPNLSSVQMKVKKDGTEIGNWTFTDNWATYDPETSLWGYDSDSQRIEVPKTVSSSADDGIYIYELTVIDKAGNREEKTVTVVVDTTAPTVSITTPGDGEFTVESSMTMRGTLIDDGSGADKLYYTLDGNDPDPATAATADINGSTWTKTINFTDEGSFTLKVMAADVLGNNTSVISRNFSYDLYDPGIVETTVGDSGLTTNANFSFGGKAWDSNQISEITVTDGTTTWSSTTGDVVIDTAIDSKKNSAADVAADNWHIDFVVGPYTGPKPATWVADGTIPFTVKITDIAGKSRSFNRTVTVDTTVPSITKETGDGFAAGTQVIELDVSPYNRLTMHASDSGTGLDGVYYQIADSKPEFSSATESSWTSMAQGMAGWTVNVDFTGVTADGTVSAWVAAKDRVGNRTVFESAITAEIDLQKPVITVTGNDFSDGENVLLTIKVDDTNPEVPEIAIKKPDGNASSTSVTVTQLNKQSGYTTYTATIPFADNGNDLTQSGTYEITISDEDENNRTAESKTHKILLDIQAPVITLTSYTEKTYLGSNSVTVTGTVTDLNLTSVTAQLTGKEQTDITSLLGEDGSFTWKQYDLSDGSYIATVVAADRANNTSTEYTAEIVIDTTSPVSTFAYETTQASDKLYDNTGAALADSALTAGTTYMAKSAFTLKGVITETNFKTAILSIKKDNIPQTPKTITASGAWDYVQSAESDHSNDGTYVYTLTLIDQANNRYEQSVTVIVDTTSPMLIITTPAASEKLTTNKKKFAGNVSDMGAGIKEVTYKLTNGTDEISSGNAVVTGASWAIDGADSTGIDLQREGTLVIEVKATDLLDQTTTETTTFYFDQGAPTLTETGVGVSGLTTNAAFTLSGTASDTNALIGVDGNGVAVGAITVYTGSGASKVDYGPVDVAAPVAPATAGTWSLTLTPGTGTGELADGVYTFYVTATDVSARETTVQRTVIVDTQAPSINKISGNSAFITDTPSYGWYDKGTLSLGAVVTDNDGGSGVASVEYAVIANPTNAPAASDWQNAQYEGKDITWKSMTKGASGFTAKAEVADGMDYIVICASDTAGNKTYTVQESAKIDTCEPALVGAYEEQACTTSVLTKVTNAKAPISVYIKTEDLDAEEVNEGSKVDSVVAKIGNKKFTTDPIIATYIDENLYQLILSADTLAAAGGADNSQKTVYIQITDNAGNKSSATSLFTLQFDTVGPDIEFITPALATVNKEISITGKANDLQGLQSVELFYLWNTTDLDKMVQIGDTKTGKDAGNWSFTFDTTTVLNHVLADGEQADLTLIAWATDSAGNENHESLTVKVDQEEDIPTVTIAQPESLAGMTSSASVWLKGNNKITGTISDDDGITGLEMSTDGTNWTNIPVSGGYFQAQLPIDGSYTVQFRVTDTAGGVFTAGNTGLTALKLQDSKSPAAKSPDGKLYLKVDTKNPQMLVTQYAYDGTSTTASDWKTGLLADTTFGGTAHTEFTLKQYVYDVNGINKVEVSVDNGAFVEATEKPADTTVDGGNTYTAWTYTVQAATLATSLNHTLKVRVTDNAEMTNEVSATFKVDNDEPTVTLGSHSEEERVRGTLFVSGTTQDAPLYVPATTMLYKVTKTADTPTDWTTTLTTSTDYGAHVVSGNLASWRIYFDDDLNNMDGYTHDRALKKILVQLDSSLEIATSGSHVGAVVWKSAGSGHNAGDLYTPLTMMYLHLKSTDAYGNETTFVRALELDPQGDIPSISIAYPSITGYGWKNGSNIVYTTAKLPEVGDSYYTDIANMTTAAGTVSAINRDSKTITCGGTTYSSYGGETVQGGIVRIQGTADGQNAIKAIYMQIDPAYNKTTGFNWKADGSAIMPNGDALSTKYTIVKFFEGSDMYGIKVGDGVSWSASLNRNSEFNGASGVQSHIGIRLYAVDTKNNVNPLNVADDIIVTIDSDSPQVGSSEELYLYQYSNNAAGTGTVVASQKYEDDMWLTGEWWIQGSVEDASGIDSVTVQKQNGSSFTDYAYTKTAKSWASSNTSGYVVKFKIGSAADGEFGKLVYQISATDKDTGNAKHVEKQISINFDNADPVLAVSGHEDYNINPAVAQNNGFYTLGSSVSETGNSTDSQSGFKRLALYFVRPGSTAGTGTLYDTYFLKTDTNNNMALTGLSNTEGLYWKTVQVIRDPDNLSALTLNEVEPNIHKGGLIKVGGTNYVITSVNGTAVTIDGSPAVANPSTKKEDAYFAVGALIIDHLLTEGNGTAANLVNGYYTDVVNDDGDNVVEKVATQGYTTFWEANICSRNIPDGAIEIHYVAFDKAGNYAADVVTGTVANNAPRLAGVMYGTDDDGSGTVEADEMKSDLFAISTSGTGTREGYVNSSLTTSYLLGTKDSVSVLKIKGATTVKPEIVGGNGTLGYSWSVTKKGESTPYYSRGYQALAVTGTDYSATGAVAEIQDTAINLSVIDLLSKDTNAKTLIDGSNQLFSFTIWDSTEGMTAGTNSQRATVEMVADLELRDSTPPKTYIKPFYWKSKTDNSVYSKTENGKSVLMGHIDLGSDLGSISSGDAAINDADDKVSGTIVIEGTAQDNVLLKDIYVQVYSQTNAEVFTFTGASKVTSGELANFYQVAHNNNGTWVSTGSNLSNGWTFSVDPESETFSQEEGHTIAWKLVLNTEKVTNVARSNVKIAVRARDQGQPALNSGSISYTQTASATASGTKTSGDTTATQTNYNQFDVVPYITGVSTRLSSLKKNNPTVYNRTSLGKYSIGADETVIFTGYNLSGASVRYINGYSQGAATYTTGTTTAKTSGDVIDYYKNLGTSFVSWKVADAARSGDIRLTVNGIPSLNNLNNNNAKGAAVDENEQPVTLSPANYDVYAYNRQPNGDNNQNLTDDVYFDFWSINTKAAVAHDGGSIDEPVMKINPSDGTIGFAFASGADTFCMSNGKGSSYLQWSTNYANFSTIALTYDNSGNAYGIAVGLDTNSGDGGYAGRMALMTSLWGRSNWATSTADNFYGNNKMRLESIGLPRNAYAFGSQKADYQIDTRRFSSSSLAVSEHNGTRGFYLAYYDRLTGQIRFRSGSTNATAKDNLANYNNTGARYFGQFYDNYGQSNGGTNGGYLGNGNINNNGEADNNWGEHRCFEARTGAYSLIAGAESNLNSTSSTTGFTAGNYVALDVIPGSGQNKDNVDNDTVVVVFYDGSDLWYVTRKGGVGNDNDVKKGSTNGNWSQPVMIFEGNGQNCTIKAGPDGSVHIACFDQGEGSLLYAYLPTATSTGSIKTATIDGYGIAGSNISIDVVKEGSAYIPYISYYVPSIRKVKMAYLADASKLTSTVEGALDGSDDNDSYTGVWECAIVPTASSVNDDNTSIGFYKNGNGEAQNIKANLTASAEINSGNCNGNGTANPVIAYATTVNTSGYIEVVQKK